uniref:Uncharacterized protein n=1 Tax=Anopheles atroparvus TaxID=41427 RepID=A0A182IT63_ANOAO
MRRSLLLVHLVVMVLVGASSGATDAKNDTSVGSVTYLDVLRRITNLRGDDIRKNLRSLRELAIRHGLIRMSEMKEPRDASDDEQSLEGEESSQESSIEPGQQLTAIAEGRKKGGGGGSNNNIVVTGGGGGGHDDGSNSISIEQGGSKKGKKGKKGKKHRKHKRKGWKKHMKKAVPIGVGLLALKALLLHFILKKLVMATAFSLLLSKKSLLVSSLIALKLLLQQPHSSDKSESSKLEVVHIPIRKDAGFHKKHQQQQQQQKQTPSSKLKIPAAPASTTKASLFDSYGGQHAIQHTHQQMADFGGKYIPLGYESNPFHSFDATPGAPSFGDGLNPVQNVEQYFDDGDELQFDRQDNGWDGWSGWNRGEEGKRYETAAAVAPAPSSISTGSDGGNPYGGWGDYPGSSNDYQQPNTYDPSNRSRYGEILEGYVEASRRRQQLMNRRKRKF